MTLIVLVMTPPSMVADRLETLERRYIASLPSLLCANLKLSEFFVGDSCARSGHEILIIREIDRRQQNSSEHFVGFAEVMEIGARIGARRRMRTLHVERPGIVGMTRVCQIDRPEAGECRAVAAIARWHHTIEHVN